MSLTQDERTAGRYFRDEQQQVLAALWKADPDVASTSPFLHHYRHDCAARRHSWSLELDEVYVLSPASAFPVPAGRFGFIYLQGTCPDCGLRVRSGTGRFVDAYTRPPREQKIYA